MLHYRDDLRFYVSKPTDPMSFMYSVGVKNEALSTPDKSVGIHIGIYDHQWLRHEQEVKEHLLKSYEHTYGEILPAREGKDLLPDIEKRVNNSITIVATEK